MSGKLLLSFQLVTGASDLVAQTTGSDLRALGVSFWAYGAEGCSVSGSQFHLLQNYFQFTVFMSLYSFPLYTIARLIFLTIALPSTSPGSEAVLYHRLMQKFPSTVQMIPTDIKFHPVVQPFLTPIPLFIFCAQAKGTAFCFLCIFTLFFP